MIKSRNSEIKFVSCPNIMEKERLFICKFDLEISIRSNCFKWRYGLLDKVYRVATLSTLYLAVSGTNMSSLKSIG